MFYPWIQFGLLLFVFTCLSGLILVGGCSLLFSYKRRERAIASSMATINVCVEPSGDEAKAVPEQTQQYPAAQGAQWMPGGSQNQIHHHPLCKKISIKIGQVNALSLDKVRESLSQLRLNTR